MSKAGTVWVALVDEIDRGDKAVPPVGRLWPLLGRLDAIPSTGLKADAAVSDGLNDAG